MSFASYWFRFVVCCAGLSRVLALNAIYVNNQKIDKIDLDRIQLHSPTNVLTKIVKKADLLTKENFTNPAQYYQYLLGSDPGGTVDVLWGKNKTYLPSIFRRNTTTEKPVVTTLVYADDLSPLENTLNNTTPFYKGDYYVEQTTKATTTTIRPIRRLKRPKTKVETVKNRTKLTKETLELLRKYFTINCTLTPVHTSTTPLPRTTTTTRKARTSSKPANKVIRPAKVKKSSRPVEYVYPPVVSSLGGVLESFYNYMHDAFISSEYISIEEPDGDRGDRVVDHPGKSGSKKTKRDSRNSGLGVTPSGAVVSTMKLYDQGTSKRVGLSDEATTKNKLTTNIHVTSEYTPATPATIPFLPEQAAALTGDKEKSSEESESEEAGEDGDYYGGFANTSYEDDDDDDEEDDDDGSPEEDDSEEDSASDEAVGNQVALSGHDKDYDYGDRNDKIMSSVKVKRHKKKPVSVEDYSEEEDYDEEDSEEEPDDGGSFFSSMFSSLGRFVRSLGFRPRTPVEYDDYDETRSTTPKMFDLLKRPTRSTDQQDAQTQIERIADSTEKQQPWFHYPSYMFNEIQEPELDNQITNADQVAVTEENSNDWFQFLMPWDFFNPWSSWDSAGDSIQSEQTTVATTMPPPVTTTTPPESGWFPNLFGGGASTESPSRPTTQKPLIPFLPATDPLQKPETWFSVIAQHVFTTTRAPKTTRAPSTTHLGKPTKIYYSGYQLWRVFPRSSENIRSLEEYRVSPEGVKLQWWKGPSLRGANDILVPPQMLERMAAYLQDEDIAREVVMRDMGQAILYENPKMTRREQIENEVLHGHPLTWYRYHRYGDIVKFLNYLGRRFPRNVELIHVGRSYEARPLTVVRVRFDGKRSSSGKVSNSKFMKGSKLRFAASKKKKGQRGAVFIEAGAHGQQWIGPSVATWILDALTKAIANNDTELENMKSLDWYIFPVMNPDGYEYSHEFDRMWRKTRSKHIETQSSGILSSALNWLQSQSSLTVDSDQSCYGVDLDRNWDHRWNEEGASRSACSEYYSGHRAFSEPEARALSKFLLNGRRNIQIYASLQSYGQTVSYPDEKRPLVDGERFSDVHEMAAVGVEALRGSGSDSSYRVTPESEMFHPRSGTSAQFARYEAGIKYSYTIELPDTGTHGFLLPPSSIESTARDTLEILKGMIDYI
ncbi:uncharacterized protein LOC128732402 [Sabethes cyaneus]|uniref:uncharacterized protein LOC128732402 n=1 Tax=Sabethes cyaneus TaxID=53552 RepID=UPI00237E657B|nr:uncharacterized protein LOC128732402 [Sabethes cyaneus]